MRAVCGLFAVLFILGPIGMGMLFSVNAPLMQGSPGTLMVEESPLDDHGTRATPIEGPNFVELFFHSVDNSMNTSAYTWVNPDVSSDITFTLQDPLINDFFIINPSPGYPMVAQVYIAGSDNLLTVNVYDNDGGTLVGTGTHGPFTYGSTAQFVEINIPFQSGSNYTFNTGNSIVIEFDFSIGTGVIHYDYPSHRSYLRLYGLPVVDITLDTYNFFGEPKDLFYPRDINFPENRRQIEVKGTITDVFGKRDFKYIQAVELDFMPPVGTNFTRNADYDREDYEYSYTWDYPLGADDGQYIVTAKVLDEQDNQYTVTGSFNMSMHGTQLTSPQQVPEEGTYRAEARKYAIQNNVTRYDINVWNTGNYVSNVNITTTGQAGWNWWLEGVNLSSGVDEKDGVVSDIPEGGKKGIILAVDPLSKPLGSVGTISLTAASASDPNQQALLTTITTVVVEYDLSLRFSDSTKAMSQNADFGSTLTYDFRLTNTGGTDDKIWLDLLGAKSGWDISITGPPELISSGLRYYVELGAGSHIDLTLSVTAPSSGGDDTLVLDIIGSSDGSDVRGDNPVVSDKITATAVLTIGVLLEISGPQSQDTDPDEEVTFTFDLINTGASSANYTITYTQPSSGDGWDSGDISISQSVFNNLAPNNPTEISLDITPTFEDEATTYEITVKAIRDGSADRFDEKTVEFTVNEVYELVLTSEEDQSAEGAPGEDVTYDISIENNGNVDEFVTIVVENAPPGWKVDFGEGSSTWSKEIEAQDSVDVELILTIPDDAADDTEDITVTITPVERSEDAITIETHTTVKGTISDIFLTLLVPLLLLIVIVVMVIVIYRRR